MMHTENRHVWPDSFYLAEVAMKLASHSNDKYDPAMSEGVRDTFQAIHT